MTLKSYCRLSRSIKSLYWIGLSFIIILFTGFNRKKLSYWISQCSESQYGKSGPKATKLRDEGNHKFRAHDNDASLRLYTEVKCTEFSR